MRKFLYYSLLCLLWISIESCKDEEVSAPAKPSFTVDKTSGLSGDTEFSFTVNQAGGAQNMSLLPYGVENASLGGVLIPSSSFVNGVATVKFKYAKVGVFSAVVASNNHSNDGTSVKNTYSDPTTITISSNAKSITEFSLGVLRNAPYSEKAFTAVSTETKIDQVAKTILVTVRYALAKDADNSSYFTDLSKLVPVFATSGSSVTANGVAVETNKTIKGGVAQIATIPTVDFSNPVNLQVTAADGSTNTYTVTVTKTPVETKTAIKNFSGVAGKTAAKDRAMPGYVDNANKRVFIYDVYGTDPIQFDSMKVKYELDGAFATLKQGGKTFDASKAIFDLTPAKTFEVFSQDSLVTGKAAYTVYAVAAPKMTDVKITSLNPVVIGTTEDFTIKLNALTGTDLSSHSVTGVLTLPTGVTVTSINFGGATTIPVTVGTDTTFTAVGVDLSGTPKAELTVLDASGFTYKVVYNISVTILK